MYELELYSLDGFCYCYAASADIRKYRMNCIIRIYSYIFEKS